MESQRFTKITFADKNYIFDFGKYKGLPLSIVIERDIDYLLWADNVVEVFVLDPDLWYEIATEHVQKLQEKRKNKIALIEKINNEIDKLSEFEKNRKRKKFFAKKDKMEMVGDDGTQTQNS